MDYGQNGDTIATFFVSFSHYFEIIIKGLRVTVLLGAIGNTTAAWINVMGVATDRFYVIDRFYFSNRINE